MPEHRRTTTRRTIAPLLACVLLLAACAQPEPVAAPQPLPELGVAPEVVPAPEVDDDVAAPPTPRDAGGPQAGGDETSAADDAALPGGGPTPRPTPTAAGTAGPAASGTGGGGGEQDTGQDTGQGDADPTTPGDATGAPDQRRVLLDVVDRRGDHGVEGPAHADLVGLRLVDLGDALEVTVGLAGPVPGEPADGEVIGIGVDLGEDEDGESSHQLFVDGGSGTWGAYLQTPRGFVAYPGTFVIRGSEIVLTVPWGALGSPTRGPVGAFVDWSRARPALNAASADRLDVGDARFDRAP